jgi:voltage-gated potassium channel
MIQHPAALTFLDQKDDSNINEVLAKINVQLDELMVSPNSSLVGGQICDVEVRSNRAFLVIALRRANGNLVTQPPPNTPIEAGDTILVMGHRGDIPAIAEDFSPKRKMRYRGTRH